MNNYTNYYPPTIIEKTSQGERAYDIYSRLLVDRIIILGTGINDQVENSIIAQLLFISFILLSFPNFISKFITLLNLTFHIKKSIFPYIN